MFVHLQALPQRRCGSQLLRFQPAGQLLTGGLARQHGVQRRHFGLGTGGIGPQLRQLFVQLFTLG